MPPAQSGESPKLNLPPPVMETGNTSVESKEVNKLEPEKLAPSPGAANRTKTPVLSNSPVQQVDFSALTSLPQPGVPAATTTTTVDAPAIADDHDLIEKEWVNKAKKIVDANRENPYNQSSEITVFKADYMKKRYNKIIKISE